MFITYALLYSFFDFPGYGDRCDAALQHAEVKGRRKSYLAQQIVLPLESFHPLALISLTDALTLPHSFLNKFPQFSHPLTIKKQASE